jgi:hypothetical protein
MRFRLTIFILISIFLFGPAASRISYGQTATGSAQDLEIQTLKEKIATKVAELRRRSNRAVAGFVTMVTDNELRIKTEKGEEYDIKLDQTLTKYYQIRGGEQKEIKIADIKKGDYIIVSGVINEKTATANFIFVDESFLVLSGKVTEVDKENYSLKVSTTDRDIYTLEIETTTKQQIINIKTLAIEGGGFSKIKEGDTIHFVIKKTGEEKENKYSAYKILIIPQEYFIK